MSKTRCESGWTGDRCTLSLDHEGAHSNEARPSGRCACGYEKDQHSEVGEWLICPNGLTEYTVEPEALGGDLAEQMERWSAEDRADLEAKEWAR